MNIYRVKNQMGGSGYVVAPGLHTAIDLYHLNIESPVVEIKLLQKNVPVFTKTKGDSE